MFVFISLGYFYIHFLYKKMFFQNLDYVIVSGARRQENRWDPTENGQIVPETKETQKRLFDDAMFRLEHKTGDADISKLDKPRLNRLVGRNESVWKDDYEANCTLRRNFRVSCGAK